MNPNPEWRCMEWQGRTIVYRLGEDGFHAQDGLGGPLMAIDDDLEAALHAEWDRQLIKHAHGEGA